MLVKGAKGGIGIYCNTPRWLISKMHFTSFLNLIMPFFLCIPYGFYPRPVLAFGYCRCLRLSVCVSVCVCVRQPWACPCHKSSRVQARTIKFGQKVQKNLVKVPTVLGGDWPWPSKSNLTWKAKFTPFWACPRHNSPHIQARTIKFGQKM